MKSIIKEIFYGKRGQSESIDESEEYFKLLEEISKLYKEMEEELSDDKKAVLNKLCHLHGCVEAETADSHFIEGMKIGVLLGIEACN